MSLSIAFVYEHLHEAADHGRRSLVGGRAALARAATGLCPPPEDRDNEHNVRDIGNVADQRELPKDPSNSSSVGTMKTFSVRQIRHSRPRSWEDGCCRHSRRFDEEEHARLLPRSLI